MRAIYQVDAFASRPFEGNPAAVVPLETWLPDAELQAIAAENNLAETAFILREGEDYAIRWFTPAVEVDLCGHATLASAYVVKRFLKPGREAVTFSSRSGPLPVRMSDDWLRMDFPLDPTFPWPEGEEAVAAALGQRPLEVHRGVKAIALLADEAAVAAVTPDLAKVAALESDGLIVTAPGRERDFVSRYFAPAAGIPEDPVTGSAHCTLTAFWAPRLGKDALFARQISSRGGDVRLQRQGERVLIEGQCVLYLEGQIRV